MSKYGALSSYSGNQPSLWLMAFFPSFAKKRNSNMIQFITLSSLLPTQADWVWNARQILMCSLDVPVAYPTFSKRITYFNHMRIWSTSEVTRFSPLQLNTVDLHQPELCDGLSPRDTARWRAGCRSQGGLEGMTGTPNQTVNNPGAVKHMQGHYFKVMHLRHTGHHCSWFIVLRETEQLAEQELMKP